MMGSKNIQLNGYRGDWKFLKIHTRYGMYTLYEKGKNKMSSDDAWKEVVLCQK